jgi:hypothetical protein
MKKIKKRKREDEQKSDRSNPAGFFAYINQQKSGIEISDLVIPRPLMHYFFSYLELNRDIQKLKLILSAKLDETACLLAKIDTLTDLDLRTQKENQILDKGLAALASSPSLTSLSIQCRDIRLNHLDQLLKNTTLKALSLSLNVFEFAATPDDYIKGNEIARILSNHSTLTSLALPKCGITLDGVAFFSENIILKKLNLTENCFGDGGVYILSTLKQVTDLSLGCSIISDIGMRFLLMQDTLQSFSFQGPLEEKRMGDKMVLILSDLSSLTSFTFRNCYLTPAGITSLLKRALTHLDLSDNRTLGDAGACILSTHFSLTNLYLRNCDVNNKGILALAHHPNLTHLDLSQNIINFFALMALFFNPTIKHLSLSIYAIHYSPDELRLGRWFLQGNQALRCIKNDTSGFDAKSLNELNARNIDAQIQYDKAIKKEVSKHISPDLTNIVVGYTKGEYSYRFQLFYHKLTPAERVQLHQKTEEYYGKFPLTPQS